MCCSTRLGGHKTSVWCPEVMVAIYLVLLMAVAKIAHSRKKRTAASEGEAWLVTANLL